MSGERFVLINGVWRRPGWSDVPPGSKPTDPNQPPPAVPAFRVHELALVGTGTVPTEPPPPTVQRPLFGACILTTGAAGVVSKYGNSASVRQFLGSTLSYPSVPAGSKMHASYKLMGANENPSQASVDAILIAAGSNLLTIDHEPDNNGWSAATIATWKALNNRFYDRKEQLGLPVLIAPTFTGGLWSSNQTDATRDVWMVGLRGDLIGIDYDGVHDNATTRPSDNRYRRGGTIITNADEIATAKRYLTRFAANGWIGATAPEFGISRASWDTDGSGRTLWIQENGQRFIDSGVFYLVQWYDFRDTSSGISDIIDPGTPELAQMRSFVALNTAA